MFDAFPPTALCGEDACAKDDHELAFFKLSAMFGGFDLNAEAKFEPELTGLGLTSEKY